MAKAPAFTKGKAPPFLKKGMKEGSKAEEAMDKKMGVVAGKKPAPAFKSGGKVGKKC